MERDAFGQVFIPDHAYWGAQTQRSLNLFKIGQKMPVSVIKALLIIKHVSAVVNCKMGVLDKKKKDVILFAINEILNEKLTIKASKNYNIKESIDSEIPFKWFETQFNLCVFQTGSGTQTNMNVNEVIAKRCNELLTYSKKPKYPIHPNDDVNKSQSTNDSFSTAMHIVTIVALNQLLPVLEQLKNSFLKKSAEFEGIKKMGRTHLQDAVPIYLSDELLSFANQIECHTKSLLTFLPKFYEIAQGATAVGNEINAPRHFGDHFAHELSLYLNLPFVRATNLFSALSFHGIFVELSGLLSATASSLLKIANDIRLMASGPDAGFSEIILPRNEAGSSIMPGKINPTQCEALIMVCCQVMGLNTSLSFAAAMGNFELNTCKTLIVSNILEMIELLTSAISSFSKHCIQKIKANKNHLHKVLDNNFSSLTELSLKIGYDKATEFALNSKKTK
jgi:fumarate hydratase class II